MGQQKPLGGAGLRGQSAGETSICTVGKSGTGLTYRGYDIKELADSAQFEEVAYLLLKGELPGEQQLDAYKRELRRLRTLPTAAAGGTGAHSRRCSSHGCAAHWLLHARRSGAGRWFRA